MRKLSLVVACALISIVVTGAVAARFFFQPVLGCVDQFGRRWEVPGNFHGQVRILDSRGIVGGILSNGFGEMTEPVTIHISGETVTVQGIGRHEIRGHDGTLLGYAVLSPYSKREYLSRNRLDHLPSLSETMAHQAQDWVNPNWDTHNGASGTESAPWGVRGFDTARDLRWRILGTGNITVFDPDGRTVLAKGKSSAATAELPEPLLEYSRAAVPTLIVTLGKRQWSETAYGTHTLKDDKGKTLLIVQLDRPSKPTAN